MIKCPAHFLFEAVLCLVGFCSLSVVSCPMITLDDCIALCGLSEEEVLAIAEHEHIPEIAATGVAEYLLMSKDGPQKIGDMILDDIRAAQGMGDRIHVARLLHALHHFLRKYPQACPGARPWSSTM